MAKMVPHIVTRDEILSVLSIIDDLVGEKRSAQRSGKLVYLDQLAPIPRGDLMKPPPERDAKLMGALTSMPQPARDELQAIYFLGRGDYVSFKKALRHVQSSGGGEAQIHYLYGKLLAGPEHLEGGLKKIGLDAQTP